MNIGAKAQVFAPYPNWQLRSLDLKAEIVDQAAAAKHRAERWIFCGARGKG